MSTRTGWKGVVAVTLSGLLLGLAACGGSGAATSGLSRRAFVSDDADGSLHIEDALRDEESLHTIATGAQPGNIRLSPDKTLTLVFNAGSLNLSIVMNSTESVLGSISLPGLSTDYVAISDAVAFATVPNSATSPCTPRCVEVLSIATSNVATTLNITQTVNSALNPATMTSVPLVAASTIAVSPDGNKMLLFGAAGEQADTLTFIDTFVAQGTPATAATQLGPNPAFYSRPLSAVFTTDSTKAFVFNCGLECGNTAPAPASVTVLDVTKSPPVPLANIPVAGATTGLLNGSTLYVAGSPLGMGCTASNPPTSAASCGTLQTIDTGALTAGAPIIITDGTHDHMELGSNNQLFIGARTCTNIATSSETRGCLTIFGTSANKVVVPPVNFDVTGIAPISSRNIVYVVQGGELRIYDTTTDALTPTQIDVVGKAVDVKYVDQ